ncbi:MAG: hypothetical protein ACRDKG_00080 [Actinomycetota bacterium]
MIRIRQGLHGRDGERGAVAVVVAILLVVVFTLLALVIDIAALRSDARASQKTGDFAAISGALALDPVLGGDPRAGCIAAYQYFLANSRVSNAPPASTACAAFNGITVCDPLVEIVAQVDVGPYHVTITNPVRDGSPLMQGRSEPAIDGSPCQRISVQVRRIRGFLFGGMLNAQQGQSEPPAVARATAGHTDEAFPSLVLLDPTGCNALVASGQGTVWVRSRGLRPGIITVDSSGTENSSSVPVERRCPSQPQAYTIDASGTQNSKIQAGGSTIVGCPVVDDGLIFTNALMPGQNAAAGYENTDVANCRVLPRPIAGPRVTRAPIDHRYNCRSSYPNFFGFPVAPCADAGSTAPYIDNLRAAIGTSGVPAGFSSADAYFPANCRTQPSTPPITIPLGNWYVSCRSLVIASPVVFQGPANIVFEGSVEVGSSGQLCVNVSTCADTSSGSDAYVYLRRGDTHQGESIGNFIKDSQAQINLMRTMVYLDNGRISFGAGSGALRWVAPGSGLFEDLALWSEQASQHDLGGQANLTIEGTFFAPYAYPFRYSGQGDQFQPKAQFVTFRMELTGQGVLTMEPDPDRTNPFPLSGVLLIR